MARRYFGTDGVRGVVGEFADGRSRRAARPGGDALERRASASSSAATRAARAPSSRQRSPRHRLGRRDRGARRRAADAGGRARRGLDLGVVISASHNPPEYNGVKFFDARGRKLSDAAEEEIEALLDAPPCRAGGRRRGRADEPARLLRRPRASTRSAPTSSGLRIAVDCANGAYSAIAPDAFERLGAEVHAIGDDARRHEHQRRLRRDRHGRAPAGRSSRGGFDLGIAFDGDGDRMLAVDERGELVDGDGIVAILALDLGVDLVAVTQMTNLGFHALMHERGIRVLTTDVGDRYVLEALAARGRRARRRAVRPRHLPARPRHRRRPRGGAAPLRRARGRTLSEAAAVMPRFAQCKENVRVSVERAHAGRSGGGRTRQRRARRARAACSSGRPAPSR